MKRRRRVTVCDVGFDRCLRQPALFATLTKPVPVSALRVTIRSGEKTSHDLAEMVRQSADRLKATLRRYAALTHSTDHLHFGYHWIMCEVGWQRLNVPKKASFQTEVERHIM